MSYLSDPDPPDDAPLSASSFEAARARYRTFHARPADRVESTALPRPPPVLASLGELRGLIYRSDRGQPGRPRSYVHFFDTPPRLLCDPAGRQLYILGGDYRVTRLGVEG